MALYKYSSYLSVSDHLAFDQINHPSAATPWSGIYRCEGCGREITSVKDYPLPPQNHHQHTYGQGAIRWKLVVTHNS
jgi:hypothetical protein